MSCRAFDEGRVRDAILNKIKPKVSKKGKHWKGYVYLDDTLVTKIKIPNAHSRRFNSKKAGYVATALKLSCDNYNKLVECTLTGTGYYKILKDANLK